jgi:peptide/nickel transport system permease protein
MRLARHGMLLFGASVVVGMVAVAVFADILAPHDPYAQNVVARLKSPVWHPDGTWEHPLGTDGLGRDYLSRLIHGTRVSLSIGFFAMLVSGFIGSFLGIVAGYFGGRVDAAIMFLVTVRLALPIILVALSVVAAVGSSLTIIIALLGLLLWDRFALVLRAATQQLRNADFITASRALGCSHAYIAFREVLPNILPPLIVVASLEMANAILLESAMSFLGVGVQPPTASWGLMIAEGRQFMFFKGWLITIPGAALFLLVLAVNMIGDGLRDATATSGRH